MSIDANTKLMPTFVVGKRDSVHAVRFMRDLSKRLANPIQLSTDAMSAYHWAVSASFEKVDYAQIVKEYASPSADEQRRYSPPEVVDVHKHPIFGDPDPALISTSYVERANLTTRMHVKRLSRLTLAFSKKLANFEAAIALHLAYYNFCKWHSAVRCTPAIASGLEKSVWTVADLLHAIA
jgi:IS1 family transposase